MADDYEAWRREVVSPWEWKRATSQAGSLNLPRSEAGGFMVSCDALGDRRAYLKPLRKEEGPFCSRAAREKIVADLAYDLGINVPPVLLFRRPSAGADEETRCAVSLVLFPRQYSWGEIKRFIVDPSLDKTVHGALMKDLPKAAAQALVLDSWVMQPDHNDHPHNMLFGFQPSDMNSGRFVFLDYAFSLGHRWISRIPQFRFLGWSCWEEAGAATKKVTIPFPPHMDRFLQKDVVSATIEAVENYDEKQIDEIVGRIPDDYMGSEERKIVGECLGARRTLLRSCPSLSQHLV